GYFLFFNSSGKTPTTKPTGSGTTPVASNPGTPSNPGGSTTGAPTQPDAPKDAAVPADANNVTNLLPGDSQFVLSIDMEQLRNSLAGSSFFGAASGLRQELFEKFVGLPLADIKRYLRAENAKNGWAFNVVQMTGPIQINNVMAQLGSKKAEGSPI